MRALVLLLFFTFAMAGAAEETGASHMTQHGHSEGCGVAATGLGRFEANAIGVLGRDRIFHLRVPNAYDPDRAYPLIFRWHGRGGDGLSGGLDIELSAGNEALVVGADGLDKTWSAGAGDLAFFDAILETIERRYCIDRARIYSVGFSAGAYFNNRLACERGDVLRAVAAIAGGPWNGGGCRGRPAAWFLHDADDDAVPIALGIAAMQRALTTNECSAETISEGEECVRYLGCKSGPVVWCRSRGYGHDIRGDFAPAKVWGFFRELH